MIFTSHSQTSSLTLPFQCLLIDFASPRVQFPFVFADLSLSIRPLVCPSVCRLHVFPVQVLDKLSCFANSVDKPLGPHHTSTVVTELFASCFDDFHHSRIFQSVTSSCLFSLLPSIHRTENPSDLSQTPLDFFHVSDRQYRTAQHVSKK